MTDFNADDPPRPPSGRGPELARFERAMVAVGRDGARVLVVAGEPGIGKTTLVEAARVRLDRAARTLAVRCSPYDLDGVQPMLRLLAALDPAFHPPSAPAPAGEADEARFQRARLFGELTTAFLARIGDEPTVVVVDDIHWGQPSWHELLAFLVEELLSRRVQHRLLLVLVTRVLPPPHPLAGLLADLDRRPGVERLDLGGLGDATIDGLVGMDLAAGAPAADDPSATFVTGSVVEAPAAAPRPSSAFVDLVRRSARGNPLRARATLRVLARRGIDPVVRPSDPRTWAAIRTAPELADPLTAWIRELAPAELATLAAGSVWGEDLTVADLEPLVAPGPGGGPALIQAHLDAAVARELLHTTDGVRYWFGHSTFREVVDQLADVHQVEAVHGRCVRRLLAQASAGDRSDALALRIGRHLVAAGAGAAAPAEAVAGLAAAGRAALRAFSWTEAARFLEAARRIPLLNGADSPLAAELLLILGQAYYFDHDFPAAEPVLEEAVAVGAACGAEAVWGPALLTWLRILMVTRTTAFTRAPPAAAAERFLAAATDPTLRSLIIQVLAEHRIIAGDADGGAELADQALAEADRSGDHAARSFALYARGLSNQVALRLGPGLDGVQAARREAEASGDWWVQGIMQARLPFALLATGRIDQADAEAAVAVAEAARRQEHSNQALGYCARAQAALLRGDFDAFDGLAARCRAEAERSSYVLADLFMGPAVVLGHLYRGEPEEAARVAATWPNLPRSGRAALEALAALLSGADPVVDLRPPRSPNQVSVGFFAANLDAALHAAVPGGGPEGLEEALGPLEAWTADDFELSPTYPASLTRVRAELARATGDRAGAVALFRLAIDRATATGAQVELARSLAGAARLAGAGAGSPVGPPAATGSGAAAGHRAGLPVAADLITRARSLATVIGLDPRILGLDGPGSAWGPAAAAGGTGAGGTWGRGAWGGADQGPGSEIAVLITDIVGSTEVSRRHGDLAYYRLVMHHHELVRSCLARSSGHEFSESGDGLLAWFPSMPPALTAALEIQRQVRQAHGPDGLRVRVSLASGPTLLRAGRPYGLLVALAARLLDRAEPDQIVLDSRFASAVPPGLDVRTREVELKGIGSEVMGVVQPV